MLKLNNLSSPVGSNRNTKRIGRGQGSGQGTQAGKGHKGQNARTGGGVRTGFEGGSLPLYMRLPKKGFSNAPFKRNFAIVSLDAIQEKVKKGTIITPDTLSELGLIKGQNRRLPVKILAAEADLNVNLEFSGITKFSKGAVLQIQKAGGKTNLQN
jgi:large subunit ribosomal protein L15